MKYFKIISYILLAFCLVLLDTSFFSFMPIYGATILSVFVAAIFIALTSSEKNIFIFSASAMVFLAIFSSLPITFLFITFLALPLFIDYVRRSYLKDINFFAAALFYILSCFLFEMFLMFYSRSVTYDSILAGVYFIVLNSIIGMLAYVVYLRWRVNFKRGEVKFRQ